jgi:hypothetical protein
LSGHTYAPSRAGNSGGGNGSKTQKVKHPVSTSEATTLRKCVVRNASPRQACSAIRYLLGYLQLAARQGKENDWSDDTRARDHDFDRGRPGLTQEMRR